MMHFKTVTNWRQIFKGPEVEYCNGMKFVEKMLPFYAEKIEQYKKMFPSLNPSCPLQPGPFYVTNHTKEDQNNINKTQAIAGFGGILPNGRYRFIINLSTKMDPMVYKIQWQVEIRNRLGEDEFK